MKVVKKETPKEEIKFENVFIPEDCFICDLAEKVESLDEDVVGLAKDILDHNSALEMLGKKIQSVEDDQLQDIENLSNVVDILGCLQETHKSTLDLIIKQNETIKILDDKIRNTDNAGLYLFWFLVIWNIVLSVLFALSIYNVLQ